MKKKIFSALLMGVFTLASMSVFVSCKDYDDDINGLDTQQQELLSRLETLEGSVKEQYTTLSNQLTEANKNASDALDQAKQAGADVTELKDLVSKATEAANEAGKTAAEAATAANNASADAAAAKEAADEAKEAADAAMAKAKEALKAAQSAATSEAIEKALADAASALNKCADLESRVGKLETLAKGLDTLIEQVSNAATKDELNTLKTQVDKYQDYFDSIFSMVTSVELYGTFSGNALTYVDATADKNGILLSLPHGTVQETADFGDNEALDKDLKNVYATATPVKNYTKGSDIKSIRGILVRVNPVNATFTKDNIKIINSLGEDLSGIVEVTDVKKFDEIITRSANVNSGLWKVYVQRADGVSEDAFENAISNKNGKICFAVAINNTDNEETADRYVASTFDLAIASDKYNRASSLAFEVDGHDVNTLKNRWYAGNVAKDETGTVIAGLTEYKWKDANKLSSAIAADKSNVAAANDADGIIEYRGEKPYLPAEVGTPFEVKLTTASESVEWYYVVFDANFGTSSAPSEMNAWEGYGVQGLNTVVPADSILKITVTSERAYGDVIGFRVFAVNYDGTLADPDGRAFYVQLGDATTKQTKNIDIKVTKSGKNETDFIALDGTFASCTDVTTGTFDKFDNGSDVTADGAEITWTLYDKDKKAITDWKDAKYIKVSFNDAAKFEDGGTFTATFKAMDDLREVNTLTLNVTKVMPTSADVEKNFSFKSAQLVNGVYTCYPEPDSKAWKTAVTFGGTKDLGQVANMNLINEGADYYMWSFAGASILNGKLVPNVVDNSTNYMLTIGKDFIDNETSHATSITYVFYNISYAKNPLTEKYEAGDYPVAANSCNTIFACPLDKSVFKYTWKEGQVDEDAKGKAVDGAINFITYGAENFGTKYQATESLVKYITSSSEVDNELYGGDFNQELFVSIDKMELVSVESGKADYYDVTYENGTVTFTVKANTSNPTADVPSKLKITATDAYGHKNVYEMDFTVKRR